MKVRIKKDRQSKVKNGGMHLLNTFVPVGIVTEVDCEDEKKLQESDQFKAWFELADGEAEGSVTPANKRSVEDIMADMVLVEKEIEDLDDEDEELEEKYAALEAELAEVEA